MTGDAGALLADGLLGDLDQNFLSFLQQIADLRNRRVFTTRCATTGAKPASTAASATAIEFRTTRALGVSRGTRGCANFHSGIHGTVAAGLCFKKSFRFRLRVFNFSFLAIFFRFFFRLAFARKRLNLLAFW